MELSIPSRMLQLHHSSLWAKRETHFQFLLGCFINRFIIRLDNIKLSIPSRMLLPVQALLSHFGSFLSIPSRMLRKRIVYRERKWEAHFQFLLGCFLQLLQLTLVSVFCLSIPSRMLQGGGNKKSNWKPLGLSIPSRMLPIKITNLRKIEDKNFQFLLGCF